MFNIFSGLQNCFSDYPEIFLATNFRRISSNFFRKFWKTYIKTDPSNRDEYTETRVSNIFTGRTCIAHFRSVCKKQFGTLIGLNAAVFRRGRYVAVFKITTAAIPDCSPANNTITLRASVCLSAVLKLAKHRSPCERLKNYRTIRYVGTTWISDCLRENNY